MGPPPARVPLSRAFLDDRTISWNERVWAVVRDVPRGRLTTYGDVGAVLGSPRYAQRVGFALSALRHREDDDVPWHRVINREATVSHRGDFFRARRQIERLEAEGVLFGEDGTCDLASLRWDFPGLPRV
jgi:methylated-DNA-protein-cysteine methyltransferase-like protein